MPRVIREGSHVEPHTFAWSVFLEKDQERSLYAEPTTDFPVRSVEYHGLADPKAGGCISSARHAMIVEAISVNRADARLRIDIGTAVWTFSGPWLAKGYDFAQEVHRPMIVPARQNTRALVSLLPHAPAGLVSVHLRVRFVG